MNLEYDLLDDLPVSIPIPTNDETLFSWCALYHRLSGNAIAADSLFQLFGRRGAGLKHDLPVGLETFCQRVQYAFGSPQGLALEKTLLGFYAPFAPIQRCRRALDAVTGNGAGDPKRILGLLGTRGGAQHPLKSCVSCVKRDIRELGYSRWIREHQWPTVWVCREHGVPLRRLAGNARYKDLRYWTLPQDHAAGEWQQLQALSGESLFELERVAFMSARLAQTPFFIEDERLRLTYLIGARSRGWIAFDGSTRMVAMNREFQTRFGALKHIPGFGFLAEASSNSGGTLGLLFRQFRGLHHPVKHVFAITFLFDTIGAFLDAFRQAGSSGGDSRKLLVGEWRHELRRLVEVEKWSVSQAATRVGIPISQACRWLNRAGVPYEKRARVGSDRKDQIDALLRAGLDYQQVADDVGVKKSFVRAYVASSPELRECWKQRRFEKSREQHRVHAAELFMAHRGVSIKTLKAVPGNGLAWLERHDREWLTSNAPHLFGGNQ